MRVDIPWGLFQEMIETKQFSVGANAGNCDVYLAFDEPNQQVYFEVIDHASESFPS